MKVVVLEVDMKVGVPEVVMTAVAREVDMKVAVLEVAMATLEEGGVTQITLMKAKVGPLSPRMGQVIVTGHPMATKAKETVDMMVMIKAKVRKGEVAMIKAATRLVVGAAQLGLGLVAGAALALAGDLVLGQHKVKHQVATTAGRADREDTAAKGEGPEGVIIKAKVIAGITILVGDQPGEMRMVE